jgi:hypothetical protein
MDKPPKTIKELQEFCEYMIWRSTFPNDDGYVIWATIKEFEQGSRKQWIIRKKQQIS